MRARKGAAGTCARASSAATNCNTSWSSTPETKTSAQRSGLTGALIKVDMGNGPFEGRGNVVFDLFWIYKIRLDLYKIAIRIDDPGITLHSGKRCETRM